MRGAEAVRELVVTGKVWVWESDWERGERRRAHREEVGVVHTCVDRKSVV